MALNGKTAVVTGAALGIGKAMTETLLQNGAKVALLDVNEAAGRTLKKALDEQYGPQRTLFMKCDVQSEEQIRAAFQSAAETFGGIDIVCNNAGICNEGEWEKTVSVNLVGVIRVAYVALEHMNKLTGGRGGVIVSTASITGLDPALVCPVYTATKHGVIGFTRAMAAASAASGYGVRFNALCPGEVQTGMFSSDSLGPFSHLAALILKYKGSRVLNPSEVAESVLELLTDETKNGEVLMVQHDEKKYMTFPTLYR